MWGSYSPKSKSHMLFRLSQPAAPSLTVFIGYLIAISSLICSKANCRSLHLNLCLPQCSYLSR